MNPKIQVLYNQLAADGYDVGDINSFSQKITQPDKAKILYNAISSSYDLGDFDEFYEKVKQESKETEEQIRNPLEGVSPYPVYPKEDKWIDPFGVTGTTPMDDSTKAAMLDESKRQQDRVDRTKATGDFNLDMIEAMREEQMHPSSDFDPVGVMKGEPQGVVKTAMDLQDEYLNSIQNIAEYRYDKGEDQEEYFDYMSRHKQVEEWEKDKERWKDRPFIQEFATVADYEQGETWYGKTGRAIQNVWQAFDAGSAGVFGGLSTLMHDWIEKPLYGWMYKNPNSRMLWGNIADYFNNIQAYQSSAAGKHNMLLPDGSIEQKNFTHYFKEGNYAGAIGDLILGLAESMPGSLMVIGSTMAGQHEVGLMIFSASATGGRLRELNELHPEMSEFERNFNALGYGAIEGFSELLGDVPIGKMLGKVWFKNGQKAFKYAYKGSVDAMIKNTTKEMSTNVGKVLLMSGVGEGMEGKVGGMGQYLLDSAMGLVEFNSYDFLNEGNTEAAYEFVSGFLMSSGGMAMKPRNIKAANRTAKQINNLSTEYQSKKAKLEKALEGSGFKFEGEKILGLSLENQIQILDGVLTDVDLTDFQKHAIIDYMQVGNDLNAAIVNIGMEKLDVLAAKLNATKETERRITETENLIYNIKLESEGENGYTWNLKSNEDTSDGRSILKRIDEDGREVIKIAENNDITVMSRENPSYALLQRFLEIDMREHVKGKFGVGYKVSLEAEGLTFDAIVTSFTDTGVGVQVESSNGKVHEFEVPYREAIDNLEAAPAKDQPQGSNSQEAKAEAAYKAKLQELRAQAQEFAQKNTNPDMGGIVYARVAGQDVRVTKGNIVFNEDGTLNREDSSKEFYYENEDGEIVPASIEIAEKLLEVTPTAEAADIAEQKLTEPIVAEKENSEVRPYNTGEKVTIDVAGSRVMGEIVETTETGYKFQDVTGVVIDIEPRQIINEDNLIGVDNGVEVDYYLDGELQRGVVEDFYQYRQQGQAIVDGNLINLSDIIGVVESVEEATKETSGLNAEELSEKINQIDTALQSGHLTAEQETELLSQRSVFEAELKELSEIDKTSDVLPENEGWSLSEDNEMLEETPEQIAERQKEEFYNSLPYKKNGEIDYKKLSAEQELQLAEYDEELDDNDVLTIAKDKSKALYDKIKALEKQVAGIENIKAKKRLQAEKKVYDDYIAQSEITQKQSAERQAKIAEAEEKRKANREAGTQKAITTPGFEGIVEKWQEAKKTEGHTDEIRLANGEVIPGRYMLVEQGTFTPSHDANKNFAPTEGFPTNEQGENVNDRDYANDKEAQQITLGMAQNFDSRGIGIVVDGESGISISGNGRSIAGQIAAQNGTDRAYNEYILKHGRNYGFTPEQVGEYNHPRIVFIPDSPIELTTENFKKFNADEKKSQSTTEKAKAQSKALNTVAVENIANFLDGVDNLSDVYNNSKRTAELLSLLYREGIIQNVDLAQYQNENGTMTGTGRDMFEALMLGSAFRSADIQQVVKFNEIQKAVLFKAIPKIIENKTLGEYDVTAYLSEAIEIVTKANEAGTSVALEARAIDMLEGAHSDQAINLAMALAIDDKRQTAKLRNIFEDYNNSVREEAQGAASMFGKRNPADVLTDVLKHHGFSETLTGVKEARGARQKNKNIKQDEVTRTKVEPATSEKRLDAGTAQEEGTPAREGVQEEKTGEVEPRYQLDTLVDYKGKPYTIVSVGHVETGEIIYDLQDEDGNTVEDITEEDLIKNGTVTVIDTEIESQQPELNPTEAQKEAGNYKKAHITVSGFDITIENPKGSERSGVDENGKKWSITMNNHYGYFKRTEGKDGDQIDVFVGDNIESNKVFVVDQVNPNTGEFDESKVMLGFNTGEEARAAYLSNYEEGWQGLGAITEVSVEDFKEWLYDGKKQRKAFSEYKEFEGDVTEKKGYPEQTEESQEVKALRDEVKKQKAQKDKLIKEMADRNGLFGDTKSDPNDLFGGEGSIDANAYAKKLDEVNNKINALNKQIEKQLKADETGRREQKQQQSIDENKSKNEPINENNDVSLNEKQDTSEKSSNYGENNKLVSTDRYEELKRRMRGKLGNLNVGFDPEILSIGAEMAVFHIEAGARKFADFARKMINDLGDAIRPYLKGIYEGARYLPGMNNLSIDMDETKYVREFDIDNFKTQDNGSEKQNSRASSDRDESRSEKLPTPKQVSERRVSPKRTERTGKSQQGDVGERSDKSRTRPKYDVNKNYSNEEIAEIVSSVTEVKDGKIQITGELSEDIIAIARQYVSGGIAKEGRGILDEYYTDGKIVDAVGMLISELFPSNPNIRVLEPSVGTGNFLQAIPSSNARVTAFEINETTAKIAKILNPSAEVNLRSFETEFIDDTGKKKPMPEKFQLVIGNPPYGEHRGLYKGLGEESKIAKYEDYFVKRSLDVLDENGILAMVLPSSWMGRHKHPSGYTIMAAYRLPSGAFEATQVGTDIVILQKKTGYQAEENHNYFEQHPDRVLGNTKERKNRFGGMESYIEGDIDSAIEKIKQDYAEQLADELKIKKTPETLFDIISTIEETGNKEKAKRVVKAEKEQSKAVKATPIKSGNINIKPSQLKYTVEKGDKTIPASKQFDSTFTPEQEAAFKDTDYSGYFINGTEAKHKANGSYIDGKWMHNFYYAEGNIYNKLEQLEKDKSNISEEQYQKQKKLLEDVLPAKKTINEISLSPNTEFAKNLSISTDAGRSTLQDLFKEFLETLPREAFGESNKWEVRGFVDNQQVYGSDKKRNELVRKRRKAVALDLFNKFLKEEMGQKELSQVEHAFNREYNALYRPDYSKVPMFSSINQTFKGRDLKLTEVQLAGIGRMTVKGVGLLAHEVGFGKTLSGILSMHEAMERGYAKKPLIVVPNDSILKQWIETMYEVLPSGTINALGNLGASYNLDGFSVNDGEITIMTYQGLKKLGFNDDTYSRLSSRFSYIMDDLKEHKSTRDKEKAKAKEDEIKGKMKRNAEYSFEDMGFDYFVFDEVHNANHIVSKVKIEKGSSSDFRSQSQRPSDLGIRTWLASQYIQDQNNGRNVLLLSATPFTNKPLEYYSVLSLVANSTLERMGFFHVDQFFETFMEADNDLEIKADGKPAQKTNVRRFRNNGLFNQLLSEFIDIKGDEDNPDLIRPERINKEYTVSQNQLTADTMNNIQQLLEDADTLLKGIGEARLAAFSPYASEMSFAVPKDHVEFVENSPKIDAAIKLIAQNKADNQDAGQLMYSEVGVEFFPFIRDYLIKEVKYKENEVAIITGGTSTAERAKIQDGFNNGSIKVIIGSPAIKEGINLQANTTDMYILSLPYNFTQLRQVEGRSWRQGNKWENIRVNYMLTEDSSDIFMLQRLQIKQGLYNEAMKSNAESVDVGDIDTAEIKTALIKNPEVRAELELMIESERLSYEKSRIESDLAFVLRKYAKYNELRARYDEYAKNLEKYKEYQKGNPDGGWEYSIERIGRDLERVGKNLEEEKVNLERSGVNVSDIETQVKTAKDKIASIDKELERKNEKKKTLIEKYIKEEESKQSIQEGAVERYVQERHKENSDGFYKLRDGDKTALLQQSDVQFTSISQDKFNEIVTQLQKTGLAKNVILDKAKMREYLENYGKDADVRRQASIAQAEKVSQFIKDVLEGKIKNGKQNIELPESVNKEAERKLGHAIKSHSIRADEIRHIKKGHGENGSQLKKNSIPLRDSDIALLPYIMGAPDKVTKGTLSNNGGESIRYYKYIDNGHVVVVEREVHPNSSDMQNITMWAEKSHSTNTASENHKGSSAGTSETDISKSDQNHSTNAPSAKLKTASGTTSVTPISKNDVAKIRNDFEIRIKEESNLNDLRQLSTSEGEVYGFVTPEGDVYIDPDNLNANTPIHEFTHLWWSIAPDEIKTQLIGLFKQTAKWKELEDNPAYSNLNTDEKKADELFASWIGNRGEQRINDLLNEANGDVTLFARIQNAINEFWQWLKSLFSVEAKIDRIADMTLGELFSGKDISGKNKSQAESRTQTITIPEKVKVNGVERPTRNSNGELIHNTTEGIENFWKWFGDSKMVDDKGNPLVLYHGTPNASFNVFGEESFFTENIEYAKRYQSENASQVYKGTPTEKGVYETYLSIKKPFDTRNEAERKIFYDEFYRKMGNGSELSERGLPDWTDASDLLEFAKEKGYDGIVIDEGGEGGYGEEVKLRGASYVPISPNQIKSATDNTGKFDSKSDDIRFQVHNPAAEAEKNQNEIGKLNVKLNNKIFKLAEGWVDDILPVKMWQNMLTKAGVDIQDHENFYMRHTRVSSMISEKILHFHESVKKPFDEITGVYVGSGVSYNDITTYMKLKHADEYTEHVQKGSTKTKKDDLAGKRAIEKRIGMPAEDFITQFETSNREFWNNWKEKKIKRIKNKEGSTEYNNEVKRITDIANNPSEELWRTWKVVTDFALDEEVRAGFKTRKEVDAIKSIFQYYVPLKFHAEATAEDLFEYTREHGTYLISPVKKGKGRATESGDPIAAAVQAAYTSIVNAEKNIQLQTLYRISRKDTTGSTSVSKTWFELDGEVDGRQVWKIADEPILSKDYSPEEFNQKVAEFDEKMEQLKEEGKAYRGKPDKLNLGMFIKPANVREHDVVVWVAGNPYTIRFNTNSRLPRSINGLNHTYYENFYGELLDGISSVTKFMARTKTTYRPIFTLYTNPSRDINMGLSMAFIEYGAKFAADVAKNIPRAAAALSRMAIGKSSQTDIDDRRLQTYFWMGGKTGIHNLFSLNQQIKNAQKDMKRGGKKPMGKLMAEIFNSANDITENMVRVAAYYTALESGMSLDRALLIAKDITANFNRSGNGRNGYKEVRSLKSFTNAGIQALYTVISKSTASPKAFGRFMTVVGVHAGLGMALTWGAYKLLYWIIAMISGYDGDDDEFWEMYAKLTPFERHNNFCFYTPEGFIKIPIGQETRQWYAMATDMVLAMRGNIPLSEAGITLISGLLDLVPYNPIKEMVDRRSFTLSSFIASTVDVASPLAEFDVNKNFMGSPIYKEFQRDYTPGQEQVRKTKSGKTYTSKWLIDLITGIDKATGGDGVIPGSISLNPDKVSHLLNGYLSGLYDQADFVLSTLNKEDRDNLIPRAMFVPKYKLYERNSDIQNQYYDIKKEYEAVKSHYNKYIEKAKSGKLTTEEALKKIDELNPLFWLESKYGTSVGNFIKYLNSIDRERKEYGEEYYKEYLQPLEVETKQKLIDFYQKETKIKK